MIPEHRMYAAKHTQSYVTIVLLEYHAPYTVEWEALLEMLDQFEAYLRDPLNEITLHKMRWHLEKSARILQKLNEAYYLTLT